RRHTRSKRDWSSDVCSSDLSVQCPATISLSCLKLFSLRHEIEIPIRNPRTYSKTCRAQPTRDRGHPAKVGVEADRPARVTAGGVGDPVADADAEARRTSGSQDAMEFVEDPGHGVVGNVDRRPEGDQSGQSFVLQVKVGHRPRLEADARMIAASDLEHGRGQVDAEGVKAEVAQEP